MRVLRVAGENHTGVVPISKAVSFLLPTVANGAILFYN